MASNINAYNINGAFPIAGQDNPSQGFRDNFTNIKNNFIYATNEITDLQNKALVTGALNGQSINNDMAGTQIIRPQLAAWTQSLISLGAVDGVATLNFNSGNFQKITTAGSITLEFTEWPASTGAGALGYGLMRVWIDVTSTAHTVTLPATVTIGLEELASLDHTTGTITFDEPGNYVFDFSSIDGGDSYLVFDVTRNHSTFRDPSFYFNSTVSPSLYIGFDANSLKVGQEIEHNDDVFNALGGANLLGFGNLYLAGPATGPSMDYREVPGYSTWAARGNIDAGAWAGYVNGADGSPTNTVRGNDYLGYYNAFGFTGNGTANVWQQTAGMHFFATGSNVQYGIGGNIAFYTKADGGTVHQTVGIENDQSVSLAGNVTVSGNLNIAGGRIESGYQYLAATTGFNVTVSPAVSRLILDPATTIANGNIILPMGNIDAKTIIVSSTSNITALAVAGNPGTVVKPSANITLSAGTAATYFFHAVESTWYKVG